MNTFNYYGLIIILVMMIPNIIYASKHIEGFENLYKNKYVLFLEMIGRVGSIIFMFVNIPYTWFDVFANKFLFIYLIINSTLLIMYIIIWIVLLNKDSLLRSLLLSIVPSLIFVFSGIFVLSIPLIISSLIFAPTHILISVKNTIISLEEK